MDRLVYTSLSGMRRTEFAQAVTANNLANASTTGFRRDTSVFQSQWFAGGEFEDRVQAGSQLMGVELDGGAVAQTGRALDVAMLGQGMLAVQDADGEAYTRRGDLHIDADGALRTSDGRAVLGEGGPITLPPGAQIAIGQDGTVAFRAPGDGTDTPLNDAGRLKLVAATPATVRKGLDGLFRRVGGGALEPDPAARVQPGALEGSNVQPVATMVELIEQSRAFELHTKLVGETRDLDAASAQLMRVDA